MVFLKPPRDLRHYGKNNLVTLDLLSLADDGQISEVFSPGQGSDPPAHGLPQTSTFCFLTTTSLSVSVSTLPDFLQTLCLDSLGIIVTLLAWMQQRGVSSNSCAKCASATSCNSCFSLDSFSAFPLVVIVHRYVPKMFYAL